MKKPTEPGWIRKLWPFLVRHKKSVLIAFGVAILGQVITSIMPLVQRAIVDNTITTQTDPVGPLLVLLVGLAAVNFLFQYIRRYSGGRYGIDVQNDLRNALFQRLQRLDFARHDELPTGQLVFARELRPSARAATAPVHADAHRQRHAARAVAVLHALDVAAAHAPDVLDRSGAAHGVAAAAQEDVPGAVGLAAARRRGRRCGRRSRHRCPRRQGIRPGRPRDRLARRAAPRTSTSRACATSGSRPSTRRSSPRFRRTARSACSRSVAISRSRARSRSAPSSPSPPISRSCSHPCA